VRIAMLFFGVPGVRRSRRTAYSTEKRSLFAAGIERPCSQNVSNLAGLHGLARSHPQREWVAPLIGGALGGGIYRGLFGE